MSRFTTFCRGFTSCVLFVVFGLGALAISPIMFALRRPELCQPVVRKVWCLLLWLFEASGLIRVEAENLPQVKGTVIVSNHPSLIDVIVFVVKFPRTLYVAKHALRRNPFMGAIVRATSLPDDERLPESAAPYLAKGWNVIVFPEGTRTPLEGGLKDFHRGAAHIALKSDAPILAVGLKLSRRILAKEQAAGDMGGECVTYRLTGAMVEDARSLDGEKPRTAAIRVTASLRAMVEKLLV